MDSQRVVPGSSGRMPGDTYDGVIGDDRLSGSRDAGDRACYGRKSNRRGISFEDGLYRSVFGERISGRRDCAVSVCRGHFWLSLRTGDRDVPASVFCGVTNCPISSLLLSFELFGFEGMPFFLLSVCISYLESGYYGLYHSQKIFYSKTNLQYINTHTKE